MTTRRRSPAWRHTLIPIFIVLSLVASPALARRGEAPYTPPGRGLAPAPTFSIQAPDIELLKSEDRARYESGEKIFRYAEPVRVVIGPDTDGTWETLADGTRLWRTNVVGKGATDVNLGFETFELPYGAKLWVISAKHDYYEGPYTHEDNADHGQLWVPVVPGDEVVVELQVSAQTKFRPRLELNHVGYGYTDMFGLDPAPKQGSCNNDVICPEGDPWRDQIQSVATYSLGGSTICTGQMVIDADSTYRPFFLTAYHCGVSSANAASMTVYWNFQSPVCGQLSGGSLAQNQTGATFRARRQDVDMALVELDDLPDPEFDVFYSGWDRSGTVPQGSVAIHHPNTDEKAISFNDDPLTITTSCIGGFAPNTHWQVDNWEDGTTEPGSSGSGLWDPTNKLLVGFLSGGLASCTVIDYDCYGRFDVAWDGATADQRLRDWLDPNSTSGLQVQGSFPSNDGQLALNAVTAIDDCGGASDGIFAPGESGTITLDVRAFFGDVTGLSGVLQSNTPGVTVTQDASDYPDALKDTVVGNLTPFQLAVDAGVACFGEISLTAVLSDDQGYVFQFPITLTVGQLQGPTGLPAAIPDNVPTGLTSDFTVGEDLTITDLDVYVEIQHTYVGDLRIQLRSPVGTLVTLLDRPGVPTSNFGCSNDDLAITFDDESLTQLEDLCPGSNPWFSGTAQPTESLSVLDGESTQGTWSLIVSDNAGADTGTLIDWRLESTPTLQPGVCEPCQAADPATVTIATAAPGPVSLFLLPDGSGDRFDAAQSWSGVPGETVFPVDATIEILVQDTLGNPVSGFPATGLVLGSGSGGLVACDPLHPDADTDATGRAWYTGSLAAGGTGQPGELFVVDGVDLQSQYAGGASGLDIRFNSADLSGDGIVDLTDLGDFASYFGGAYDYAADFVWNGSVGLEDLGRFAESLGKGCPTALARQAPVTAADGRLRIEFANGALARDLVPGEEIDAFVVLRGDAATRGVEAWEATLVTSPNVRVRSARVAEGHLDLGDDTTFVVGTGAVQRSDSGVVVLARLRVEVTDDTPATLALAAGPIAARGETGPGVVVHGVGLRVAETDVALLNGGMSTPTVRDFALTNVPNPFNPSTEIALALPRRAEVELAIFDVSGRLVRRFPMGTMDAGEHRVTWRGDDQNGRPVVSGVYYARVYVDGEATGAARKMSLLK